MTNAGRLVGSGAFGGGRQAIMEAEGDRNLGTNLANITGKGYDTAYNTGREQFNTDQQRRMLAQENTEKSRQYGNTSGMTDRSNAATFGLDAAKANEQSRQFGHSSSMTDRSNAANFGLQAAGINERSRETGARMGLDALQSAMSGASNYGSFLNSADANTRQNINTVAGLGDAEYARDQAGITGEIARFNETAALPGQALKLKQSMLPGMPVSTTTPVNAPTTLAQQLAALGSTMPEAELRRLLGLPEA